MGTVGLIWAESTNKVIGKDGDIPWHLPEDLKRFKQITSGSTVLMGRKTWESLPFKPLPGRKNLVLTADREYVADGAELIHAIPGFKDADGTAWVMGGSGVYKAALPFATVAEVTEVDLHVAGGDAYAPALSCDWREESVTDWMVSSSGLRYRYRTFLRQ